MRVINLIFWKEDSGRSSALRQRRPGGRGSTAGPECGAREKSSQLKRSDGYMVRSPAADAESGSSTVLATVGGAADGAAADLVFVMVQTGHSNVFTIGGMRNFSLSSSN